MSLMVRAVQLKVFTRNGNLGRTVSFNAGLNLIQGGNNRGKTQVVQGIIYALGMERMLSARANAPLGSALTNEVIGVQEGEEITEPVVSSWVAVELENEDGRVITAQRYIKHPTIRPDLVRVWNESGIRQIATSDPSDYFLHLAGSVQGALGFHTLLMQFIGWDLPNVIDYSGKSLLLYPDVIFPFIIVDQQAWVSSGPRKVERYQIREPVRRSAEFLLSLEGPMARKRREELELRISELQIEWTSVRSSLRGQVSAVGGRVVGLPERPAGSVARSTVVQATDIGTAELQIIREGEWTAVQTVLEALDIEFSSAVAVADGSYANDATDADLRERIIAVRTELNDVLAATRLLEQDLTMSEAQLAALDRRIDGLGEELARNKDIATLVRLGSETSAHHIADHSCPTCRQSLDDVEASDLGPTLNVSETVGLLNAQIATAKAMRERSSVVVAQSANAYGAMQREIDHLRVQLRALEGDAITPQQVPKSGDIARRISAELRRDEVRRALDALDAKLEDLARIALEIAAARNEFIALPDGLSESDQAVLASVGGLMRDRLRASGFGSYDPNLVQLDLDSMQPVRQGFDVDTDASASDVVRIKLAYVDAMRQVGSARGAHPGLLILDEPRQQDMELEDYESVLKYLAASGVGNKQVIVTSTTGMTHLRSSLNNAEVSFVEMGSERLLDWDFTTSSLDR